MFLLLILGFIYLKKKNKFLYNFSLYWMLISLFVFAFVILVSRNHMMDFIWPLVAIISVGIVYLIDIMKDYFKLDAKKGLILTILIVGIVSYHLFLVNRIVFGELYDSDAVPRIMAYAQEINKIETENTAGVIAIPGDVPGQDFSLAYLTNKSFIVFRSETLEKLLAENKTDMAFEKFNVKYILGYPDLLSGKITENTKAINIASDSLDIEIEKSSEIKSFLLNLFR